MEDYFVYVQTDDQGRITAINSSTFLEDITGWVEIDRGTGDKYHHAQGNYLPRPIYTDEGIPRYKLVDGQAVERTAEEIAANIAALPPPPMTQEQINKEAIEALIAVVLGGTA